MAAAVVKSRTVAARGRGVQDYSGVIYQVQRSQTFRKLVLRPDELLKEFMIVFSDEPSLFPWVVPPVAPLVEAHLVDTVTGFPTPYLSPAGYEFRIVRYWSTCDQPILSRIYADTVFAAESFYPFGGVYHEQEPISVYTTSDLDPTFLNSHLTDLRGINVGDEPVRGTTMVTGILTKMGSEPFEIETKKVKCPTCGKIFEVDIMATKIECPDGHEFMVKARLWGGP